MSNKPTCRFCGCTPEKQSVKGEYVYGAPEGHHFWQCDECQMVYLYPLMTPEQEKEFYIKEFEKFMGDRAGKDMDWSGPEQHIQSSERERIRRESWLPLKDIVGKRVLEIGCSSGFLLTPLREKHGVEVVGIEPSGVFSEFVKQKGITIYDELSSFKAAGEEPVDLAIHYYVLEHIRDPEIFLKDILLHVKPGGQMIFEVPCVTDPLIELYDIPAFDKFYWSFAHHWYFSRKTLAMLLDRVDMPYEIFPEQRYDLSNHMVWMMTGRPGGMGRFSHVFGEKTNSSYKEDLKKSWICDTLVAKVNRPV